MSENAKKLLERLNELYKRICELMEEKKKLIAEYQERLKQIESELVSLFVEAGKVLDELESQYGLSMNEVKNILKFVPDKFFKNALKIYRKKPERTDIDIAVRKTFDELVPKDEDASTPAIIKTLKAIQRAPPSIVESVLRPAKKSIEVFFCPLCQEEHDIETERDSIYICKHCKSLIETYLIGMNVFKNHGQLFVLEWKERAEAIRKLSELEKKYNILLRYLKSRNIVIPRELAA